jgi:hypothetical protein
VPFFNAFGAVWGEAMVARWSVSPFGMLRPAMDAASGPDDRDSMHARGDRTFER